MTTSEKIGISHRVALAGCGVLAAGMLGAALLGAPAMGVSAANADAAGEVAASAVAAPTVTTSGTCTVTADPDTADISMGIYVEAADAVDCQNQAADIVDAAMAALEEAGVAGDHVTTQSLNIYPRYDYSADTPFVNGYRIDVSLNVVGIEIDRVGQIVSVATGAGVNEVYGVQYYTSSFDALYQDALLGALDAARAKADAIAGHEGMALAGIQSVTEGYENRVYRSASLSNFDVVEEEAAADAGSVAKQIAIDPGTVEINASVTATYELTSE